MTTTEPSAPTVTPSPARRYRTEQITTSMAQGADQEPVTFARH